MSNPPPIDNKTIEELLALGQERAIAASLGKLTDTTPGSPVTAILEGVAYIGERVQSKVNSLASTLEASRISVFGIDKRQGLPATGLAKFTLDALYAEAFLLPKGFRLILNGVTFETVVDLTISPFTDHGEVNIVALDLGTKGNLPVDTFASFPTVTRLLSVALTEPTKGGQDQETDEQWKYRIYQTIRRRDTLISEEDFEAEVQDSLGLGSVSLAIGRLKGDRTTYANGYVFVFALNPDGSQLNTAQISQLQDYLNRKAAMALVNVASIDLFDIKLEVIASFVSGRNPELLANDIKSTCADYLKPGNLQPGTLLLNKALERRIQNIQGIQEGLVSVLINGFAQPQAMPNAWTVGNLKSTKVILTPTGGGQPFEYNL
ncbi:MAG: baseplate J/gp47 family protein [Iphinoe sp. HA4291-MV1]|jgi:uncharacterized phage protein gp47/JayE|nr:baseplate J/gp47 family protein [Iphinoe sp. HA4291-MV1]